MAVKSIIDEIEEEVTDVTKTDFVHNDTFVVPSLSDSGLTYESGVEKKGKKIETCVLFVDIRNSVTLTEKHHTQTMGRIYTAFTKAVLKLARHHNGHTRNIIGDRVMVVFPVNDCFINAVDCAISINHVAVKIINKKFNVDFKCGIGIDFGELRVIKVGIQRNGNENGENKGLVWVGYPANLASRLTDVANKEIEEEYFEVFKHPLNPLASDIYRRKGVEPPLYNPKALSLYDHTKRVKEKISVEEFAKSMRIDDKGEIYSVRGKIVSFEKKLTKHKFPPILLSESVFKGYKKAKPNANDIKGNCWKEQKHDIPNVNGEVYGAGLNWKI